MCIYIYIWIHRAVSNNHFDRNPHDLDLAWTISSPFRSGQNPQPCFPEDCMHAEKQRFCVRSSNSDHKVRVMRGPAPENLNRCL